MSNRRKATLDALEERLTGAKRIALFGHRAVGKTTLLAMFYREAASGRVPAVRLAAGDPATAEYLAEKIAQIESGEPPAGTLAETPLRLRLYHDDNRLDLVVKDYQGEHVTLGQEAPILDFFADCDAVLLCLDSEISDRPVERQRRQQEVENLLERCIDRSNDGSTGRPVALLVTKYDRVLDRGGPPPHEVERLVEAHYGMTRHVLTQHVPRSAIFAVSSYGRGAGQDGRPPADLHPLGLEGPLLWLAEQLEHADREQIDWIWDLAPDDLPRLTRCVKAFEHRHPKSDHAIDLRHKLNALRRSQLRRRVVRVALGVAVLAAGLAGYDAWGYHRARAFEHTSTSPVEIERRWSDLVTWHPTLGWFWPKDARQARAKLAEWTLKADEVRVAAGTAEPDLTDKLQRIKEKSPELTPEIKRLEQAQDLARHDKDWKALQVGDLIAVEHPEEHLAAARAFLRTYPETSHKSEAVQLIKDLENLVARNRDQGDRQIVDALVRSAGLPNAPLRDLIERAEQFLNDHPDSRYRGEVEDLMSDFVRKLDLIDIEKARTFSRENPTNFVVRRQKYQDYLKGHSNGGRFLGEAHAAVERIDAERDVYLYRQAYDHYLAHPDDAPTVASRMRSYLDANPDGRYRRDAESFLAWWEKTSTPHDYTVVLRRAEVDPDAYKTFAGGAPDLCVELWVAGVKYGPSPVVANSHRPIWDYQFPKKIRWKYGDPVTIRITDTDWSDSYLQTFNTPTGDKLAMRMLSGQVRPAKGGKNSVTFSSDFQMPRLTKPEDMRRDR